MVSQYIHGDVEFCFFRPGADEVFLVGDFNGWHRSSLPMIPAEGGWWVYRLHLAPGNYQFKYLVDGEWVLDYAAFGIERGPLGFWNSVVVVDSGNHGEQAYAGSEEDVFSLPARRRANRPLAELAV